MNKSFSRMSEAKEEAEKELELIRLTHDVVVDHSTMQIRINGVQYSMNSILDWIGENTSEGFGLDNIEELTVNFIKAHLNAVI